MRTDEIINYKFSRAFRGYDIIEVDALLDEIVRSQERMEQDVRLLELRNDMLLEELARLRVARRENPSAPDAEKQPAAPQPTTNQVGA
ncbi:MAG: DivIVA domain-containing protein [Christensenellaceae bacterium]|jgi:DivIVA domain-containing protein|nr:DivIVA domain-containing protein [Christensenellaceae bacterium]